MNAVKSKRKNPREFRSVHFATQHAYKQKNHADIYWIDKDCNVPLFSLEQTTNSKRQQPTNRPINKLRAHQGFVKACSGRGQNDTMLDQNGKHQSEPDLICMYRDWRFSIIYCSQKDNCRTCERSAATKVYANSQGTYLLCDIRTRDINPARTFIEMCISTQAVLGVTVS